MEEILVWKLISYFFQIYKSYEIKFPTKISSFTVLSLQFVINFEGDLVQDQFRRPLRLQHGPDSKSKRQNLSDHGQSPKHLSPQELSVSIRISSATACVYERRQQSCDGEICMRIVKKFVTAHAD